MALNETTYWQMDKAKHNDYTSSAVTCETDDGILSPRRYTSIFNISQHQVSLQNSQLSAKMSVNELYCYG